MLAPLLPTVAGFVSFIWSLCASIFLRPFAPDGFPSFPATTDALTSAGRLFGPLWHEHRALSGEEVHCLSQQRFLPFCLQSCDVRVRDFLSSPFFFHPYPLALASVFYTDRLFTEHGLLGARLRVYLVRSPVTPHRIEFISGSSRNPCITDWHFISSCSPRSGFLAAVSFHYRLVDFSLTGTCTPLRCCVHSRTRSPTPWVSPARHSIGAS